jgi:hypothetical protein
VEEIVGKIIRKAATAKNAVAAVYLYFGSLPYTSPAGGGQLTFVGTDAAIFSVYKNSVEIYGR